MASCLQMQALNMKMPGFGRWSALRNIEFLRDWGLPYTVSPANETILTAGAQLLDEKKNSFRYQVTNYKRDNDFNGLRNSIVQLQDRKRMAFNNQFNLSNTNSSTEKGFFLRPVIDISKKFKAYGITLSGANFSVEHNEVRNKLADSVNSTSFSFQTYPVYR